MDFLVGNGTIKPTFSKKNESDADCNALWIISAQT